MRNRSIAFCSLCQFTVLLIVYLLALSYKRTLVKHLFYKLNSASYHSRCFRMYSSNSTVNRIFFKESAYWFPTSVIVTALAVSLFYVLFCPPTTNCLTCLIFWHFRIKEIWKRDINSKISFFDSVVKPGPLPVNQKAWNNTAPPEWSQGCLC